MAKTQEYTLSSDGKKTTVIDTTTWGDEDGARSSYAISFGLLKYTTSGFSICQLSGSDPVNITDENPSFVFDNKKDGYYKIRAIYMPLTEPSGEDGAVYYSGGNIYLYSDGSFSIVSYNELMQYGGTIIGEVVTDIGFSPLLEKRMDKIWYEYYTNGTVHRGREYDSFLTLYSLLVGARSVLLEGAYAEFDRVIDNANTIALRKFKEFKITGV